MKLHELERDRERERERERYHCAPVSSIQCAGTMLVVEAETEVQS